MHEGVKKLLEREYAEQRSEEWLELRQGMLTASDAIYYRDTRVAPYRTYCEPPVILVLAGHKQL